MEQVRIRDLSGQKIAIDGSFLNHDEEGEPARQDSETLLPRFGRSRQYQKKKYSELSSWKGSHTTSIQMSIAP